MMYVDYPEVTDSDRLARAQLLDAARVALTPAQAWLNLKTKGDPDEVRLTMFDGRPAYWFRLGKARAAVYADNGQAQTVFPADLNLRTAAAWTGQSAADARSELMTSEDQWTVGGIYYNYEPITKYSWPDGEQVYIPRATGEVVQYTTRASRVLAYLGPVAHWLYFTPLRKNPVLWSRIVIWLSGVATAVAIARIVCGALAVLTLEANSLPRDQAAAHDSWTFLRFPRLHLGFQRHAVDGSVSGEGNRRRSAHSRRRSTANRFSSEFRGQVAARGPR